MQFSPLLNLRFSPIFLSRYCISVSISKKILKETYSNYEVLGLSGEFTPNGIIYHSRISHLEILKLCVSYLFLRLDPSLANKASLRNLFALLSRGRKLLVLVLLYAVANVIPFYAINIIGAPIFTVVMQLKIFATAGFSSCMLKRLYSPTKWRALILLVVGCILVSTPVLDTPPPSPAVSLLVNSTSILSSVSSVSTTPSSSSSYPFLETFAPILDILFSYGPGLLGLCATLLQATISGFTSVYFEALLKDDDTTIWERNFQLAFYSLVVMMVTVFSEQIFNDPSLSSSPTSTSPSSSSPLPVQSTEIFSHWTYLAVVIAVLQALGGLLVAGTLRYADSVLKCFATAVSIVLTSIIGFFFLGNHVDFIVILGYCVTIISIFNYTLDATPTSPDTMTSAGQGKSGKEMKGEEEEEEIDEEMEMSHDQDSHSRKLLLEK
jgi:solute carrier family 35 (UDP-sugar transporter), member A1/2/3